MSLDNAGQNSAAPPAPATQETVPAPSPLPLNIASALRLVAGIIAGFLVTSGHGAIADPNTIAGILLTIATVAWIAFKNTNAAKTLAAWMASPAVTVIEASLLKKPSAANVNIPMPILVALLVPVLAISSLLGGCASSGVLTTAHLQAGKDLVAAEAALDAAVVASTALANNGSFTPAQKAKLAALTAPCPTGVAITIASVPACPVVATLYLARKAYAASNASTMEGLAANLLGLAVQVKVL